jgi:hypothetical protein
LLKARKANPECPGDGGLRGLACSYGAEARERGDHAVGLGKRHRFVHFAVGIVAVIAGVVAGITGLAESNSLVTGIAGFTASALAGTATRLDAERLARFHFAQAADYGAIGRLFETLATAPAEPTRNELDDLIGGFARIQGRGLDEVGTTAASAL